MQCFVLRHLLPVQLAIQEKCAKLVQTFAQFLHIRLGSRTIFAHFFWVPWDCGWECPAHNFYTIFSARCNFLKICGCTGHRCLKFCGRQKLVRKLVARAIRNAIHANRFARIIRNWTPYFYRLSGRFARITRIRRFARITPLRWGIFRFSH